MVDINKIVWNLKERWEKIHKGFDSMTNYFTMFDYIKNAKNIWLIGHDNIDGDSLGSTLAMKQWLENKFPDKKISAYTNWKPGAVFDFLEADIYSWKDLKLDEDIDLFIILDSANFWRLWELYDNNKEKLENTDIINIDHHVSNEKYWTINILDYTSPASAQIVYEILSVLENKFNNLINQTKVWFDEKVANYILLWILTDTQVFSIPLSDEKTFLIAADLIKKWADKNYLIDKLFKSKHIEQLKLEWLIFDRVKVVEKDNLKFCYSYYTMDDLIYLWLDTKDSWLWKWLVSKLTSLIWMDFVVLWRVKETETSLSFRSKSYDVNNLAKKFWWGGHKNAAWAKIKEWIDPKDIETRIVKEIYC